MVTSVLVGVFDARARVKGLQRRQRRQRRQLEA
jgi:hypothetical protein